LIRTGSIFHHHGAEAFGVKDEIDDASGIQFDRRALAGFCWAPDLRRPSSLNEASQRCTAKSHSM
jgi:hypothetical protein